MVSMQVKHVVSLVSMLTLATACSQTSTQPEPAGVETAESGELATPVGAAASRGAASDIGRSPRANGAVVDGPLADDPGFQVPVPGASTGGQAQVASVLVQSDDVQLALLEGMQASGADIRVQVSPRGVVSLSGDVATVADRQRANYLARALPGVAEVDIRNLNVRQR